MDRQNLIALQNEGYTYLLRKAGEEAQNVINYLRTNTRFKRTDTIDVFFTIESGRVWATISSSNTSLKVPAIDIIR